MKLVYVVSTLSASGPTNQLYNIVSHLNRDVFDPYIITLSPEPKCSRWKDFELLNVCIESLNLSRTQGLFFARKKLKEVVDKICPSLIHTQGLRADSLLSSLNTKIPWVMTARNFPPEDYLTKFGHLKGKFMVYKHFSAMHRCRNLIACSRTIQEKLSGVGIQSTAIQNGVRVHEDVVLAAPFMTSLPRPIYVSVGNLIPRKNMQMLIDAFRELAHEKPGSLVILGDGPLMPALRELASEDVYLLGNVPNVADYLAGADYFVSASLSEGLPNTVLEALAAGLPIILSDIESHREIANESGKACKIFALKSGVGALYHEMSMAQSAFDESSSYEARLTAHNIFSAEVMSNNYQNLYKEILEAR